MNTPRGGKLSNAQVALRAMDALPMRPYARLTINLFIDQLTNSPTNPLLRGKGSNANRSVNL